MLPLQERFRSACSAVTAAELRRLFKSTQPPDGIAAGRNY